MTSVVSFAIAGLGDSSALLCLRTAGVSPAIASLRLTALGTIALATDGGFTIPVPSFALSSADRIILVPRAPTCKASSWRVGIERLVISSRDAQQIEKAGYEILGERSSDTQYPLTKR